MLDKSTLGKVGETLAVKYLKKLGYHILDRNVRTPYSEIDIIAIDKETLVFVEVKNDQIQNMDILSKRLEKRKY